MNLLLHPSKICGAITPPPSKSQSHRVIIAAALARGESVIKNVAHSKDIDATLSCMKALGAEYSWSGTTLTVSGLGGKTFEGDMPTLDCCESGSTLRFLIPVALAVAGGGEFQGQGRLMQRPQEPYFEIFREKGIEFDAKADALIVRGRLKAGEYSLRGDVSSQFITGLMYALAIVGGKSKINITTKLESKSYVDMTLQSLALFGVNAVEADGGYELLGGEYTARDTAVEADWSQSAFFYAAKGAGNDIEICGMDKNSKQGDKVIDKMYSELCGGGEKHLDVSDCPDLVPTLALHAALRAGEMTYIENAARLRIKESDRLAAVTEVLNALGAKITEHSDSLEIFGVDRLNGGATVSSHNDHRIAMMTASAVTACRADVVLTGAQSVEKSYPEFWKDMEKLGLEFEEVKGEGKE